jgi:hypothetical protein
VLDDELTAAIAPLNVSARPASEPSPQPGEMPLRENERLCL